MNKAELIAVVARAARTTNRDAETLLDSFRDVVQASVRLATCAYPGLGKFSRSARKARIGRQPSYRRGREGKGVEGAAGSAAAAEFKRVLVNARDACALAFHARGTARRRRARSARGCR